MKVAMLLFFLGTSCIVGSGLGEYQYLNSEQLKKWYEEHTSLAARHDKVPLVFDEEVLFTEEEGIAIGILFVIPIPYDVVKEKVSNAIAREFGIKSTRESTWRLGIAEKAS